MRKAVLGAAAVGALYAAGERSLRAPVTIGVSRGERDHREAPSIGAAAVAGALATYGMDVAGGRIVAPALGLTPPSGLGRWIGHMVRGRFTHEDIRTAEPVEHEATIGMVAHYAIGLMLGVGYALLLRVPPRRPNSVARATTYGIATTALPWFWMFPARGQGVMGLRHGDARVPTFAFCTHVAYGLGLGAGLRLADSSGARRS